MQGEKPTDEPKGGDKMTDVELLYFNKYKQAKDVTFDECYPGGKNCGSCMYYRDHDSDWRWFENDYCSCVLLHKDK